MASDDPSTSVASALAAMATAVQRGDFKGAESIGNAAPVPLALSAAALQMGQPSLPALRPLYTPLPWTAWAL